MADPILSAGSGFFVSPSKPTASTETAYELLTWTEIGQVESLGNFGGSAQMTEFTPLKSGVVQKLKGSKNYGQVSCVMAEDIADAGQILLKAGFDGAAEYTVHSFKVVNSDGAIKFFTGLIGSFEYQTGGSNDVRKVSCNVEVNSKPVPGTAA